MSKSIKAFKNCKYYFTVLSNFKQILIQFIFCILIFNYLFRLFHSISDNDGPYYWHIKSGTIQRDPPESAINGKNEPKTPLVRDAENVCVLLNPLYFNTVSDNGS